MILLIIKITYPDEFCRAVNRFVVIRGSNTVRVTIQDTNTNIEEKSKVIPECTKCHPSQHLISGKVIKT